jgi:hypothetical protein
MSKNELKAVKVSFLGKATSMGVLSETDVYSIGQKKLLKTAYTNSNKAVTRWVDNYFLFPARYLICYREISNTGNHTCGCAIIQVSEKPESERFNPQDNGKITLIEEIKRPNWAKPKCQCQTRKGKVAYLTAIAAGAKHENTYSLSEIVKLR